MNIDALKVGLAPAEAPTPETAPAAPVEAAPPASAAKAAPATTAAPAAPSGPPQAQREAAAARRRREQEAAAAQETAAVELVPFGNVDTSDFIRNQALAIQNDPMVIARKKARQSAGLTLFNPFSDVPQADLVDFDQIPSAQEVARDQYALDVYKKAAAREDLLRAIRPDSRLMQAAPEFKTPQGAALYRNAAKVQALNTLIKAKRQAPSFEVVETFFETNLMDPAVPFDDPGNPKSMKRYLDAQLDLLTAPSIRPYSAEEAVLGSINMPNLSFLPSEPPSTRDTRTPAEMRSDFEEFKAGGSIPSLSAADRLKNYYDAAVDYAKQLDENYRMRGGAAGALNRARREEGRAAEAADNAEIAEQLQRPAGRLMQKEVRVPILDKELMPDEDLAKYYDPQTARMMKNARDRGETELVYTQATDTSAN